MILETAVFTIRPGDAQLFRDTFARARRFIETSEGFHRLELRRGIEVPDSFILGVWWQPWKTIPSPLSNPPTSPNGGPKSGTFLPPRPSCIIMRIPSDQKVLRSCR